jgi:hypothetical protein
MREASNACNMNLHCNKPTTIDRRTCRWPSVQQQGHARSKQFMQHEPALQQANN